ncbi:response regulator [Baekduia sp. Peel2402]|uniref:response regulator n=1 Tax=Baekduia sp. Peel2402 TaxID=3458296 RepID=UPI00403E6868
MLRVFIADDSLGFGTLASAWLEAHPDIEVAGAARSAADAIAALGTERPDVVILDRLLPQPEHSEQVLAFVRAELPEAAVLLVSGMPDEDLAGEAAAAGADGHVSKAANADALAQAVLRVAAVRAGDDEADRAV